MLSLTIDKHDLWCHRLLCLMAGEDLPIAEDVDDHVRLLQLDKGQVLFEMGQPHPYLHVIRRGCVKTVYRRANGDEWIQDFLAEGAFFGSVTAMAPGGVCSYACEALEPCEIERIGYAWIEAKARQHPAWQAALLCGWKDYASRKEWREHDLLTLSPPQRYAAFVARHAGLAQRLPQKELARYLGITPVSLSRIRSRLQSQALGQAPAPSTPL
jgi:CRP-like cAMP-binding protein